MVWIAICLLYCVPGTVHVLVYEKKCRTSNLAYFAPIVSLHPASKSSCKYVMFCWFIMQ